MSYSDHPRTPDPYVAVSKKAFDGQLKSWRKALHRWDTRIDEVSVTSRRRDGSEDEDDEHGAVETSNSGPDGITEEADSTRDQAADDLGDGNNEDGDDDDDDVL
jgi:Histone RNA hairpin-binding protein RNA-binding domain